MVAWDCHRQPFHLIGGRWLIEFHVPHLPDRFAQNAEPAETLRILRSLRQDKIQFSPQRFEDPRKRPVPFQRALRQPGVDHPHGHAPPRSFGQEIRPDLRFDEQKTGRFESLQKAAHHTRQIERKVTDMNPSAREFPGHALARRCHGRQHKIVLPGRLQPLLEEFLYGHHFPHADGVKPDDLFPEKFSGPGRGKNTAAFPPQGRRVLRLAKLHEKDREIKDPENHERQVV